MVPYVAEQKDAIETTTTAFTNSDIQYHSTPSEAQPQPQSNLAEGQAGGESLDHQTTPEKTDVKLGRKFWKKCNPLDMPRALAFPCPTRGRHPRVVNVSSTVSQTFQEAQTSPKSVAASPHQGPLATTTVWVLRDQVRFVEMIGEGDHAVVFQIATGDKNLALGIARSPPVSRST